MSWNVLLQPVAGNETGIDEKNEGGIAVFLQSGSGVKEEVSRVAFARRHSRNPNVKFRRQLEDEIEKAKDAAVVLNEQFRNGGGLV